MRDSGELITIGKKNQIVKYIQQTFKILKKTQKLETRTISLITPNDEK